MTYFLAPALVQLRTQTNGAWPKRSKASDGWIGDTSHSARVSDHNPDYADAGIVRALDITVAGINVSAFLAAATGDPRTAYVIYNRRIWTPGKGWQPYSGSNPHIKHVHVSVKHTAAGAAAGSWALGTNVTPTKTPNKVSATPTKAKVPTQSKAYTAWAKSLQRNLNLWKSDLPPLKPDGVVGPATVARLKEWQTRNMGGAYRGTKADGIAGPLTVKPLGLKPAPRK